MPLHYFAGRSSAVTGQFGNLCGLSDQSQTLVINNFEKGMKVYVSSFMFSFGINVHLQLQC